MKRISKTYRLPVKTLEQIKKIQDYLAVEESTATDVIELSVQQLYKYLFEETESDF